MLESKTDRGRSSPPAGQLAVGGSRRVYPCSNAQTRFLIQEQVQPGNPGRNVFARWRLDGEVSRADLQEAWRAIVARHETLRTFFAEADGAFVQIVEPQVEFHVREIDLTLLTEAESAQEAERIAALEAQTPFALDAAPLLRVTHVRRRATTSVVMVTAHHTVCDGWSVGLLAREMGEYCKGLHERRAPQLPELSLGYGDYAVQQRERLSANALAEERAVLSRALAGYKQFELLPDYARPPQQTWRSDIASVLLERSVTGPLAKLARDNGCTLFTVAYATLLVLLHRHSGETDIALGTQVAGRDEVALEPVVGTFVNTIVLRTDAGGDPAFRELLERARDTIGDAFDVRHVPTETIVEIVAPKRDPSRNPLLSTNFVFQRSFVANENYGSFDLIDLPSRSAGAVYDLNFFMVERPEGWRLSCEYNLDLFASATVTKLIERFAGLLREVAADPDRPVSTLPICSDEEQAGLLALNRTRTEYPSDRTVHELFSRQAARTPRATAATCDDAALTYRELDEASNRLARELHRLALPPGRPIGVCLERSLDLPVVLLGILKSGHAYVAVDPALASPEALSGDEPVAAAWVTRLGLRDRLVAGNVPLLLIDSDAAAIEAQSNEAFTVANSAEAPAYAAFGADERLVAISHRSLINLIWAMRERLALRARDSLLAVTTVSSDLSALDFFLPLLSGAELVIARDAEIRDGGELDRLLARSGATVMQAGRETWQRLADADWPGNPALKTLCPEVLPPALASRLIETTSEVWNLYGVPEATICSFAERLSTSVDPATFGRPLDNTQAYIVDASGNLVPPGSPGELYLGGDGIALHAPDENAGAAFVPDSYGDDAGARLYRTGQRARSRPSGRIELLERTDRRPHVDEAAADVIERPVAGFGIADPAAPQTPTEWELRGFVAALLGHDRFGGNEDLFACGFHSLLALRLVARIKQFYDVELSLRAIVENPSVSAIAARIDALRDTVQVLEDPEPITTLNPGGKLQPLFFLHSDLFADGLYCHRLAAALGPDQPIHSVEPHGTAGLSLLRSVEAMAADYVPRIRALQPAGPYRVGGFCASGLVAYEVARLLQAQGEVVDRVVLVNASPLPRRSVFPFDLALRTVGLNQRLEPKLRTLLCYNLARLHAAVASGPIATIGLVLERVSALLKRRGPTPRLADPQAFEKQRGEWHTENSFAHVVAALTYHPKPYAGEVTLIWGTGQKIAAEVPAKAWRSEAREVHVVPMAGGHVEPLSERVDDLARSIERSLR